jgi:hypothetical protein
MERDIRVQLCRCTSMFQSTSVTKTKVGAGFDPTVEELRKLSLPDTVRVGDVTRETTESQGLNISLLASAV